MGRAQGEQHRIRDATSGAIVFVGLQQGAVPLVADLVFDRQQAFAPATWLPSPWWWITCVAIVAVAFTLVAVLHAGDEHADGSGHAPPGGETAEGAADPDPGGAGLYDAASSAVLLLGVYCGVAPFVSRLVFHGNLFLAFPLLLPSPWWWIVSLAVVAATCGLLILIDHAKERRFPGTT